MDTKINKEAATQWIRKHKVVTVVLLLLFLIGIGSMTQSSSDTPSVQAPATPSLAVGDTGYLYEKGSLTQAIEVATTKDNFDQLISLAVAGDTLGMAKMVMDEQAFLVDPGTQVKVIGISFPDVYEVRVLSGQYYSQSGWLPGEFVSHTKISSGTAAH